MNVQDSSRFRGTSDVRQVGLTPGYMSGFGNSFETEALAGALPVEFATTLVICLVGYPVLRLTVLRPTRVRVLQRSEA